MIYVHIFTIVKQNASIFEAVTFELLKIEKDLLNICFTSTTTLVDSIEFIFLLNYYFVQSWSSTASDSSCSGEDDDWIPSDKASNDDYEDGEEPLTGFSRIRSHRYKVIIEKNILPSVSDEH